MTDRFVYVDAVCEECGTIYKVRRPKFLRGDAHYCSKKCYHVVERRKAESTHGFENAKHYWSSAESRWISKWIDDSGKQHNTSYPKWLWIMTYGSVPDEYSVTYKDMNPENIDISNLELVTAKELADRFAYKQIGKVMSEDAREKMSLSRSGKPLSDEHKKSIGRATKQMWADGVFDTAEIRQKYSETAKKTHTGKKMSKESIAKMVTSREVFYSDDDNRERVRLTRLRGEAHPNWKDGASVQKYPQSFRSIAKTIRQRDGDKCRICQVDILSGSGRVHHIDANKDNCSEENLILLCNACHGMVHSPKPTSDPVILAFRSQLYK